MKKIYTILLFPIIFIGCQEATEIKASVDTKPKEMMVGGACSYTKSKNNIEIVSINENKSDQECYESVTIHYKTATGHTEKFNYNVSKEYMIEKGFKEGTTQTLQVSTIKSGTCTPIIKTLIGLDEYKFKKECRDKKR